MKYWSTLLALTLGTLLAITLQVMPKRGANRGFVFDEQVMVGSGFHAGREGVCVDKGPLGYKVIFNDPKHGSHVGFFDSSQLYRFTGRIQTEQVMFGRRLNEYD